MSRDSSPLARAALAFLRHPPEAAFGAGLRLLGRKWKADRAWFLRYNSDLTRFWNTHEWTQTGVRAFVDDLQATPVSLIAWLQDQMLQNQAVMVADIEAMPRSARALQTEFRRQGNKSVLSVPVFHRGRLTALIGFDRVRRRRDWTAKGEDPVPALRTLGTLFLLALEREREAAKAPLHPPREGVVFLTEGESKRGIDPERIVSITSTGDYTMAKLDDGSRFTELRSLRQWQAILPGDLFARVGHRLLVRLACIQSLERKSTWRLILTGEKTWHTVGRAFRKELRWKLGF